jgi:drug/metabolite transporter (DMT)-like permease
MSAAPASTSPAAPASVPGGRGRLLAALITVYVVWGSTYLAMREAMEGLPPLLMAALRFLVAGSLLFGAQRARGDPSPTPRQWASCARVGVLLLAVGNGGVAVSEQWVATGLAAVMVASVPLWAALFAGLWGRWPSRREGLGLLVGSAGVLLLNLGGDLRGAPQGALVLLVASAAWALGSVWSRRLDLPQGLMASAAQMLCGGAALLLAAAVHGDRPVPGAGLAPWAAVAYLVVFGSIVGYSAYGYLLRHASPALATSYAFANPVVALLLGAAFRGEHPGGLAVVAMGVILGGVALVVARPTPR